MNIIVTLLCSMLISMPISACPTCVGRVIHDSPLFFSQEFYKKEFHAIPEKISHKNSSESDKDKTKESQS